MSKDGTNKDRDKRRKADEDTEAAARPGAFDDLPWAEEPPSVQERPPTVRPPASSGRAEAASDETAADAGPDAPYTGPDRRAGADELNEDALAEAQLIVANDVLALERERDDYLDQLRRVQADFENYRKRTMSQQADVAERAAESLVQQLLPVLDACDAAVSHGADDVAPVQGQLVDTLVKAGLERLDPDGEAFDPNFHEAVMHEPAEDDDEGSVVAEVLRTGYTWKGRVLRPAMVKVRG
ncbi:MAG: nucleotide exchange factor GrpE [Acidimicrobiales bacterium]|nr:nucleotide exchange factor GrpE [Acidimicrobiales bacterium]MCB9374019.1 nucleotide exchange factor GrpE [Microthrixaceae bacterium]